MKKSRCFSVIPRVLPLYPYAFLDLASAWWSTSCTRGFEGDSVAWGEEYVLLCSELRLEVEKCQSSARDQNDGKSSTFVPLWSSWFSVKMLVAVSQGRSIKNTRFRGIDSSGFTLKEVRCDSNIGLDQNSFEFLVVAQLHLEHLESQSNIRGAWQVGLMTPPAHADTLRLRTEDAQLKMMSWSQSQWNCERTEVVENWKRA